ncbi:MAG: PaaI family thioesterase [Deltaproteobacteria bacterium]
MAENMGIDQKLFDYIMHSIHETPFYQLLGLQVNKLGPGMAELEVVARKQHTNPLGVVHGGLYMSILDAAMGNAVRSLGVKAVTVDLSTGFVASAALGDPLIASGEVLRSGKNMLFARAQVSSGKRLLADARGTFYRIGAIEL